MIYKNKKNYVYLIYCDSKTFFYIIDNLNIV